MINLSLSLEDLNEIILGLGERPLKSAGVVSQRIRQQADPQVQKIVDSKNKEQ
jgi:hypothetical protein